MIDIFLRKNFNARKVKIETEKQRTRLKLRTTIIRKSIFNDISKQASMGSDRTIRNFYVYSESSKKEMDDCIADLKSLRYSVVLVGTTKANNFITYTYRIDWSGTDNV